jgi:hypothetical protein
MRISLQGLHVRHKQPLLPGEPPVTPSRPSDTPRLQLCPECVPLQEIVKGKATARARPLPAV